LVDPALAHDDSRVHAFLEDPYVLVNFEEQGVGNLLEEVLEDVVVLLIELVDVLGELRLLLTGPLEVVVDELVQVIDG